MGKLKVFRATFVATIAMMLLVSTRMSAIADTPKQLTDSSLIGSTEPAPTLEPAKMDVSEIENSGTAPDLANEQWLDQIENEITYRAWKAGEDVALNQSMANMREILTGYELFTPYDLAAANQALSTITGKTRVVYYNNYCNVTIGQGRLIGIGINAGTEYRSGDVIERGVLWNLDSGPVSIILPGGKEMFVTHDNIIVIGSVLANIQTGTNTAGEGTSCSATCAANSHCCAKMENGVAVCRCVLNATPSQGCLAGGPNTITCSYTVTPSRSNRDDFTDRERYEPQTPN